MKTFGPLKIASAFLAASMIAVPAYADRGPTQDEAKAIAAKLTAEGFTSWEAIELDNDGPYWEIDDARAMDGQKYNLKLSPTGYGIIKRYEARLVCKGCVGTCKIRWSPD